MIELKNVSKYYSSSGVTNLGLHNINLKLNKGEIVAITGDSGSGKSTLLNVISKIDTFDEGEIYYKGNETSYFSINDMDDFRKNKIGFIFQDYKIVDSYTVLDNVMLPLLLRGIKTKTAEEEAMKLIKKVGLEDKIHSRGSKLSGGEKQRCVIARALASKCEILICDEPTGNLDSKTGKEIIELIKENASGRLVLIVTHNFDEVKDIVTRKIRMVDGAIVEDVVYEKKADDAAEELDLDYKRLSKKIDFAIAKRNIISTPKKTIFLGVVIFTIALITIFLFQLISTLRTSFGGGSQYNNTQENRLYIYDKNHRELDIDKIKEISATYVINPFYEDEGLIVSNKLSEKTIGSSVLYCRYPGAYKHIEGRVPDASNEVFLIMPSDYYYMNEFTELIDQKIKISRSKSWCEGEYIIVGYGTSDNVSTPTLTGCINLERELANVSNYLKVIGNADIKNGSKKLIIRTPYENPQIEIKLFDIYTLNENSYEIIKDDTLDNVIVEIPEKVFIENQIFEVSVYSNNPNKTAKALKQKGFAVDIVKNINDAVALELIIANITIYSLIITASFMLLFVFFITYFILAKVYSSKIKDYQILRTLGVTKRDMRIIVCFEVGLIGVVTMCLAYITCALFIYLIPKLSMLKPLEVGISIIYFGLISLFIYQTIRRFNKKLFKFSVVGSMKGEK